MQIYPESKNPWFTFALHKIHWYGQSSFSVRNLTPEVVIMEKMDSFQLFINQWMNKLEFVKKCIITFFIVVFI